MDKDIENVTLFTPKPYDKIRNDTGLEEVLRDLVEQQRIANLMKYTEWLEDRKASRMDNSLIDEIEKAIGA